MMATYGKRTESIGMDYGLMHKNIIRSIIWGNKSIPLLYIEPFESSILGRKQGFGDRTTRYRRRLVRNRVLEEF